MSVHASVCVLKILLSCASHVPSVIVSMLLSVLVYSWSSPATWGHGHGGWWEWEWSGSDKYGGLCKGEEDEKRRQ